MSRLFLCISMLVCLLPGCGGGANLPELGLVTGKVTSGGQPVVNARVTFTPKEGRPSTGLTDADGLYALNYTVEAAGAMLGQHTVTVVAVEPEGSYESDEERAKKAAAGAGLPAAAKDGSITKDVKSGSQEINIEL
ncbi:MAG: carboxypeptidase regulatory-like domain-containing protein [Planctomycetaceae bacterium]|nr:carboxypeptidase regulatory-like domain-containing protein [Planctomycetaceae bacterium]